jgi:hypothetical protein
LIQSIYVYCRLFYTAFSLFNIFGAHKYTVSIAFSGMLLGK